MLRETRVAKAEEEALVKLGDSRLGAHMPSAESVHELRVISHQCGICWEEDGSLHSLSCAHRYCEECLVGYFEHRVQEANVVEIPCPDPACSGVVQPHEIATLLDAELFEKYQRFTLLAALSQDPTCRWCPNKECGNAIIGHPSQPQMQCPECATEFCYRCQQFWHPNLTCEEYAGTNETGGEEKKFTRWKRRHKAKPCPRCGVTIQKNKVGWWRRWQGSEDGLWWWW
jgi:IBR domain, a half RING-finger domain